MLKPSSGAATAPTAVAQSARTAAPSWALLQSGDSSNARRGLTFGDVCILAAAALIGAALLVAIEATLFILLQLASEVSL